MSVAASRTRFRLPRRTVRVRLTLLYVGLFLASGVVLLFITNVGTRSSTGARVVSPGPYGRRAPAPFPNPVGIDPVAAQHSVDLQRLAAVSIVALGLMVIVSIGLGWWVAGRVLRPVRTITTTAQAISASNLHQRLALEGPDDEFKELGDTLDGLLGRLEAAFASQRHFVANASHELRTPLTEERALLQVALADPAASVGSLRTACEEVLAIGAQQERLIAALLTLATSERGVDRPEWFDLATIAARVVDARRSEADQREVTVDVSLPPTPMVGDPSLVESLVANLVDNALRHNVAGGRVEVATGPVSGPPRLVVGNSGPVIPAEQVAHLFEPFRQIGAARVGEGHGLGLAIVAAITDAHGGTVSARPRAAGGLDVEVTFPAAPTDRPVVGIADAAGDRSGPDPA